jgi:hypothetical protein
MQALPPISDRALVVGFMVLLVLLGIGIGMVLCMMGRVQTGQTPLCAVSERLDLQQRLRSVEERLKALEERQP